MTSGDHGMRLGADYFERGVIEVARGLLGRILVVGRDEHSVAIRLTETEAYGGDTPDPGSHAHRSRTPRNDVMFARGGFAYVYRSYGIHWCMNIVTGQEGRAAAVLLRAGQVVQGIDLARKRRSESTANLRDRDLARGPGRLCMAAGVTHELNRVDVARADEIGVWEGARPAAATPESLGIEVGVSTRTGVSGAGADLPYRFYLPQDPTVSPHRPIRTKSERRS